MDTDRDGVSIMWPAKGMLVSMVRAVEVSAMLEAKDERLR